MTEYSEYQLPVYLPIRAVQAELDNPPDEVWSQKRTRQFLVRHGFAVKVGGRWKVATGKLRRTLPDLYDRLFEKHAQPTQRYSKVLKRPVTR